MVEVLAMPHRHFLVWQAWLELEWNRPNRSDHYLMAIARMQSDGKKELDAFKIKFRTKGPVNQELVNFNAQMHWMGLAAMSLGGKVQVKQPDGTYKTIDPREILEEKVKRLNLGRKE